MTHAPAGFGTPSRRDFLRRSGALAAGAAALQAAPGWAHVADDQTIRLALIGCGGRGTGAVRDALSVPDGGPMELYALADLLPERIDASLESLRGELGSRVDVPEERRFVGFDAYRHAINQLRPGDVALCTTRAYIRPVHVEYAVQKGVNVFMEKPFASDPAGLKRILAAGKAAQANNVKIAAGLQCRHSPARQALIDQIRDGQLGDIHLLRANRFGGGAFLGDQGSRGASLMHQLDFGRIHLYWVGAGHMVDYLIHQIDECCWIKDAWPVEVRGLAGRTPDSRDCGQNLDAYAMEYTFADGAKAFCGFRRMNRTEEDFATYIHGTRCAAQFSGNVHAATVQRYRDQRIAANNIDWKPNDDQYSPWQYEWNHFIASIRQDLPHNEAERAAYADLVTQMGRAACHMGRTVTWDEMLASDFAFCADLDGLNEHSPTPIAPDADGQFAVPVPGKWNEI